MLARKRLLAALAASAAWRVCSSSLTSWYSPIMPTRSPVHDDRHRQDLDVHHRAVLAAPLSQAADRVVARLPRVGHGLRPWWPPW